MALPCRLPHSVVLLASRPLSRCFHLHSGVVSSLPRPGCFSGCPCPPPFRAGISMPRPSVSPTCLPVAYVGPVVAFSCSYAPVLCFPARFVPAVWHAPPFVWCGPASRPLLSFFPTAPPSAPPLFCPVLVFTAQIWCRWRLSSGPLAFLSFLRVLFLFRLLPLPRFSLSFAPSCPLCWRPFSTPLPTLLLLSQLSTRLHFVLAAFGCAFLPLLLPVPPPSGSFAFSSVPGSRPPSAAPSSPGVPPSCYSAMAFHAARGVCASWLLSSPCAFPAAFSSSAVPVSLHATWIQRHLRGGASSLPPACWLSRFFTLTVRPHFLAFLAPLPRSPFAHPCLSHPAHRCHSPPACSAQLLSPPHSIISRLCFCRHHSRLSDFFLRVSGLSSCGRAAAWFGSHGSPSFFWLFSPALPFPPRRLGLPLPVLFCCLSPAFLLHLRPLPLADISRSLCARVFAPPL